MFNSNFITILFTFVEIDCGNPDVMQTLGSTNLTINCTTMGCSFEFACDGGSEPLPMGTSTTVVCQANGKWNYTNIYCEGRCYSSFIVRTSLS